MKHITTTLLILASLTMQGQGTLPALPENSTENAPDLRLASMHLDRAGEYQQLAVWLAGTSMLIAGADRLNNGGTKDNFRSGVLVFGAVTYLSLNFVGSGHQRKAAAILGTH